MLRLLALVILALAGPVPQVLAQGGAIADISQGTAPDYATWEATARRAEDAIEAGRASNVALEQLREELATWRSTFLSAQSTNQTRIQTLREQIAALGPAPTDGAVEAPEIAERRAALDAQLARLQAPVLSAEESYRRADGLIREIDTIIRERQADELLRLGPSPLNPANWSAGLTAVSGTLRVVTKETTRALDSPILRTELRNGLPAIILYLAAALLLLLRGRRWMEAATMRLSQSKSHRARSVWASLISLGQILLPFIGLLALIKAFSVAGVLGLRGGQIANLIPPAVMIFFFGRWLGGRIFPKVSLRAPLFNLSPERTAEGRWLASGLGLVLALGGLLRQVADFGNFPIEAEVTLGFPLLVLAGILMFRLGQLLLAHVRADAAESEDRVYRNRLAQLAGRGMMAVAVAGPALAAVGYAEAATFFTYPAIGSLGLVGMLAVLQRFVVDVYALLAGDEEGAENALAPVLIILFLSVLALPLLALIWGARVADLTELWARFAEGFVVGDTRISPSDFATFLVVFAIGYTVTRLVQGGLRSTVLPKTKIDAGGQNAIVSGLGYVGIFIAGILAITAAGIDLSSLAIVAGALSVGIGFGLQNIVSNFVSGIILLIERPVSEGDWIEVGGVMGTVRDISVRSTTIETFDRRDVIIPNADLVSGAVTNWTKHNLTGRLILPVGVAYGSDTRKVEQILKEVAESHPIVIVNPPPQVLFMGFGASSLDFEIRVILRDVGFSLSARSEMNHEINRRFAEEGIEIPFAQHDIWLRNPETLAGRAGTPETETPQLSGPRPPSAADVALREPVQDSGADGDGDR
ncbi:MAG: mechanosensitive ion channel protein MscS [Confluentimicrobium sp.]|uniref:DUF3772 domain-containing protein n=1 Tax=Actibacterium sp. TaxID=1872125 RepID=UPI000C4A8181|nr:DUF3772 domain-containing protein [Actibacterium sp.]MBC57461.1 mechanosensitive ion channel protein MscS [Actibacterium sp.]